MYTLLTDNLVTGKPLWVEPAQEKWFIHVSFCGLVGCHNILILGKSPINGGSVPT